MMDAKDSASSIEARYSRVFSLSSLGSTMRDEKAAPFSRLPRGEIADALIEARALGMLAGIPRLSDGILSAADIAVIVRAAREWRRLAGSIQGNPEEVAAFRARAILEGLEPRIEEPFSLDTVTAAERILAAEERARKIITAAGIFNAAELGSKEFAPTLWGVPGLIAEGLTLLSAPPKAGKSWMLLGLLRAVATGGLALGRIAVPRGRCLYISLEDSDKRLQARLERLGGEFPLLLDMVTDIPKGFSLPEFLAAYLTLNHDTRLIAVDTLGRALRGDVNDYETMTALLGPLQKLALEHHAAIVLVHHVRKGSSDGDVFDSSLGSQGIFGAMDTSLVLERKRGESAAVLHVVGRDVQDASYSLELDLERMAWTMTDTPPEELRAGPERRQILALLKAASEPMKTGEIAKTVGRTPSTASEHLKALSSLGIIYSPRYGYWAYRKAPESTETSERSESTETSESQDTGIVGGQQTFGDSALSATLPAPKVPSSPNQGGLLKSEHAPAAFGLAPRDNCAACPWRESGKHCEDCPIVSEPEPEPEIVSWEALAEREEATV